MNYNPDKMAKKIKRMEFDVKANYVLNILLGFIIGIFFKTFIFNNILILILSITGALYGAFMYAERKNKEIDRLKWELDIYLKQMEKK